MRQLRILKDGVQIIIRIDDHRLKALLIRVTEQISFGGSREFGIDVIPTRKTFGPVPSLLHAQRMMVCPVHAIAGPVHIRNEAQPCLADQLSVPRKKLGRRNPPVEIGGRHPKDARNVGGRVRRKVCRIDRDLVPAPRERQRCCQPLHPAAEHRHILMACLARIVSSNNSRSPGHSHAAAAMSVRVHNRFVAQRFPIEPIALRTIWTQANNRARHTVHARENRWKICPIRAGAGLQRYAGGTACQ